MPNYLGRCFNGTGSRVRSGSFIPSQHEGKTHSFRLYARTMLGFKPSISKIIAAHRRRRRHTLALIAALRACNGGWLTTHSLGIRLFVARLLQRRATRRLVNAVPESSEKAREKLQYTIAVLIADGDDVQPGDIEKVIETLRQFRLDIRAHLGRDIFSKNV
jgi:hypothetical protein